MGVSLNDAKLLVRLGSKGVSFRETLTLARQQLFFRPGDLEETLRGAGIASDKIDRFLSIARDEGDSAPLFELLGATSITSMDYSDYQGATLRHDLNSPVETRFHERFDFVFDGGTIEHVFNFPVAIRNAMEMVKVGGSFVSVTPANNQMGHGFYQFSPELFYNVLSPENGYRVDSMIALELSPANRWFTVANPADIGARVTLTNFWGVNLFVHAVRESKRALFERNPQQSDYSELWKKNPGKSGLSNEAEKDRPDPRRDFRGFVKKWVPAPVFTIVSLVGLVAGSAFGFRNSKFFKRVTG